MLHLDLFSGIGGFAYAADQVWDDVEHTFVEFDPFCQQVLKKHWPEAEIHGDIRQFNPNTTSEGLERRTGSVKGRQDARPTSKVDLLTGGFPCQPFSAAGLRRGTSDDRYLWPEMLRVIRLAKPKWVIAENVGGLVTWNDGMVLETVCADLEAEGYEVQPFIIPAVAVNAPHRRDRVWFIGHAKHNGQYGAENAKSDIKRTDRNTARQDELRQLKGADSLRKDAINSKSEGLERGRGQIQTNSFSSRPDWNRNWLEVATELCGVDDGLSAELDGFKLSKSQHRKERLKSLGNAIVPQIAIEIMRSIKSTSI